MSSEKRRSPTTEEIVESIFCQLLTTVCFSLLGPADKREALETATEYGRAFADEWPDEPNRRAYVDTVVWHCHQHRYHVDDVELKLWEEAPGLENDPRVLAFALGCYERRRELGQ